ncbi:FAD-binding oxidoreductase [Leptothrix discophora]|uniref:FAD-binding oxidoreductase n=1 Tax=Leptothrix discophora TaxID=89 RepID=A0ABT9G6N0_LEPDI|nr:FAD-binding oxidoreductase [Leptothrix discophora]MDP4302144.1 FAD-binding oxidoreductase [Leptothrix discophora]
MSADALPAAALADLRAAIGPAHVLTGDVLAGSDGDAWLLDRRRRYVGRAAAVLRPASTAEVAAVLRIASAHRLPVVPQGGNTGLVGGSTPDESGHELLLSLRRLDTVRAVDAANLTMTLEAGCILQTAQQAARDAGLLLPLSLAAEGSCTVGGNLASNAGGVQVLRYGNARELCLGLEVVTPSGEVWDGLRGLRKDNTGYDLRDLYIGSEGTLGVITAAVLRLHPPPRGVATALAGCDSAEAALALLHRALAGSGGALTAFEVMNAASIALVARHLPPAVPSGLLDPSTSASPWTVLLETSDASDAALARDTLEAVLAEALDDGLTRDVRVAQSLSQSQAFWRLRESIPLAQAADGLNIKHDIALPVSRIPAFIAQADAAVQALVPGARPIDFGHWGDGNLHYNVMAPAGVSPADFLARWETPINTRIYDLLHPFGGSISAEHGIGRLKRDELAARHDPVALGLMRRVKRVLDPLGIMNPGRVLGSIG